MAAALSMIRKSGNPFPEKIMRLQRPVMRSVSILEGVAKRGRASPARGLVLATLLILLAGCSHQELPPVASTPSATPAVASGDKAEDAAKAKAYETASKACKEETEKKGFGSVLGIFSRLRPGSSEADYAACMKLRGYDA